MLYWTLSPVSGPAIEPVTLAEARAQVKEYDDITDRDSELTEQITAAREWAEDFTGRALIDQTWRLRIGHDQLPRSESRATGGFFDWRGEILLRRSPVLAIESFKSIDGSGAELDIAAADYALQDAASKWPRLAAQGVATWPTVSRYGLEVVFRAGYADQTGSPQFGAEVVPARFKQAIKLHIQAHYNRDEDMQRLLDAATNLLRPERCHLGFS